MHIRLGGRRPPERGGPAGFRSLRAAIAGALLALGAPLGLALLRGVRAGDFSVEFWKREANADPGTYLYLLVSTVVVFAVFGFVLGSQADRLVELSQSDYLTGLRNRRALAVRLEEELARAERYQEPVSLLLVDVDHLKVINDRDGHRAGDDALRLVARAIQQGSRASDLAARWGGDEFALLAPRTDREAGRLLAERVRRLVLEAGVGRAAPVTVSAGVATLSEGAVGTGGDLLVRLADQALYRAKEQGRDCVVVAGEPSHPVACAPQDPGTTKRLR